MEQKKLPLKLYVLYGAGCFGWSISLNLISVLLNYLYLPPANAGLKNLIPDTVWLGFINVISIILFSGRAFDAIMDPFLANLTDKSKNKLGRRIPFIRYAFIPLSVFSALIFIPLHRSANGFNIAWLAGTQLLFYLFYGMYTIPYNALLADMGYDAKTKLNLSTAQSVGFMVGIVVASSATIISKFLVQWGLVSEKLSAYQYSVVALNIIGAISLGPPAFLIDEKKYAEKSKYSGNMWLNIKKTFAAGNFRIFVLADTCYYMSVAIIAAGLLYYLKSMLKLDEDVGTYFMLGSVAITLIFYFLVNWLSLKISRKWMMIVSFAASAVVFSEIFFLGRFPFSPVLQAILLVVSYGIPNSFLQIIPNTLLADIAHSHIKGSGSNQEGMFFGIRAFFQKLGQTLGVTVFAVLLIWGKDPGHDLGLRLSGIAGAILCALAAIVYIFFKEDKVQHTQ
jgi:GPH family glycoside/pentoside/hexuronide:cation symporter